MRCRICSSLKRSEIELAATGTPARHVATRYDVSESALERHMASHPRAAATPAEPAAVLDEDATPQSGSGTPDADRRRTRRRAPLREAPRREPMRRMAATAGQSSGSQSGQADPASAPSFSANDDAPATSRSPSSGADEIRAPRSNRTARQRLEALIDDLQEMMRSLERPRRSRSDRAEDDDEDEVPFATKAALLKAMVSPIRLLGQMNGEIGASETSVASSPFYKRVRAAVVESLRGHPAAARSVIAALERVERGEVEPAAEVAA